MDKNFVLKMRDKYHEYNKSAEQTDLNRRLIENEKWYRKKQDELSTITNRGSNKRIPAVKGGYLFNAIITKHADAMDNYPDISILPREEKDTELAKKLTGVIPYILEKCDFEKVYNDNWFSKLKTSSCYSVVWDQEENDGKGEIKITKTDLLNFSWQPNVADLEQSEFVFYHTYIPRKAFIDIYGVNKLEETETITSVDTYEKYGFELKNEFILIVDAYYKKKVKNKTVVHFAKFSGTQILFSSEDEKNDDGTAAYPLGYYDHGKYPFVFDVMYPAEQSIAGFGICDVVKDIQSYIDATDELIQINNRIVGKPRYLYEKGIGVNSDDLTDLNKEFIPVHGSINDNSFKKLPAETLPAQVINSMQNKKDELKEVIGNRDFQQGGTAGGVTSGSAISLLQSVGDKLSRDIIKSSYRSYKSIILLVIELIRQFYDDERTIRITGKDGDYEFVKFSNIGMKKNSSAFSRPQSPDVDSSLIGGRPDSASGDFGAMPGAPIGVGFNPSNEAMPENNYPLFDVILKVQKSNPYSRELNNQTVLELAARGLLNPQNFEINLPTLNALQFEGKDALIKELKDAFDKMTQAQQAGKNKTEGITPGMEEASSPPSMSDSVYMSEDELIDVTDLIQGE